MDRPLLVIGSLSGTITPGGSIDPGSGSNGRLLVDCTTNDGALIETISLIARRDGIDVPVCLYLSRSAVLLNADAFFMARFSMDAASVAGDSTLLPLWPLLAPVPAAGNNAALEGLRLARGFALWAACQSATAVADAPNILVQGGFY